MFTTNSKIYKFKAAAILLFFSLIGELISSEPGKITTQIQQLINELEIKKHQLQGGAIAILHKGKIVYKTTFGKQNGQSGQITPKTLFPLASVSKVVSATAIALIADKGIINLDEKFSLPFLRNPVSLINVLSHTTGYEFSGNAEVEQGMSRANILNLIKKQQPRSKPGQFYKYSNTMFSLVEEVLNAQNASLKFALETLCKTLGTQELQLLPLQEKADVAYPHTVKTNKGKETIVPLPFPPYYPKLVPAAAGIFASLDGMIELFKLCFGYRSELISPKTLEIMYTPIMSNEDCFLWNLGKAINKKNIESLYALGWRVFMLKQNPSKKLIFHSGYINGISSFIGFIPDSEIGIIFLSNQRTPFPVKCGINFWANMYLKN